MTSATINVQLVREDRDLILKYGYPFEQIKASLREFPAGHDYATIPMPRFELKHLIGDLCRSLNHDEIEPAHMQTVIELIDRLEYIEETGDGDFDIL